MCESCLVPRGGGNASLAGSRVSAEVPPHGEIGPCRTYTPPVPLFAQHHDFVISQIWCGRAKLHPEKRTEMPRQI